MSTHHQVGHTYTIKEVSQLTGLPSSTLRYYETIGIVKPVERGETSKQRIYRQTDVDIIDTVSCLNATGMKLEDMRQYIDNLSDGLAHSDDQVALLENQLSHLNDEALCIERRQKYVALKVEYWKAVKAKDDELVQKIALQSKELSKELKKI